MATKTRKICFFALCRKNFKEDDHQPYHEIENIIHYILSLTPKKKLYDLKDQKCCLLESATFHEEKKHKVIKGFFKSARYSFRPNLLDRTTGNERKNPKTFNEGDKELTHFLIKIVEGEVIVLLEVNGLGLTIQQIVNYFKEFASKKIRGEGGKRDYTLSFFKIGSENFLEQLKTMERTKGADIYFDKSLLGSSALNFSNRTLPIKRELVLTIKAEKKESIKETAVDIFNVFSGGKGGISKIRIFGKDSSSNDIVLDTTFLEKQASLDVELNALTGEISTVDIFRGLSIIANSI